jgi:membrane protein DedA with SNARE-associated domain
MTAAGIADSEPADPQPADSEPAADPVPPQRWLHRRRVLDVACLGGIVLAYVLGYVTIGLTPSLLSHQPQILELLDGSNAGTVTAGALSRIGRLPLIVATSFPLLPILTSDVFFWWAGRRFGERILAWWCRDNPRRSRWVARTERLVGRYGVAAVVLEFYLPVPNALILVLAGSAEMPLGTFLLADLVGSLLWYEPLVGLGYALGRPAVRVAGEINHYSLLITLGLIGLLVGYGALSRLRARSSATP